MALDKLQYNISSHFSIHWDQLSIKGIPKAISQTLELIKLGYLPFLPFSPQNVLLHSICLWIFCCHINISVHSIFSNKVALSQETVLLFGEEVYVETREGFGIERNVCV